MSTRSTTTSPVRTVAGELPESLRPAIEKYRDEADALGRPPQQLIDALRAAGAFRLYTPRELGGFETPLAENLSVLERLGRIDGPTAWIVWNLNMGYIGALLDDPEVARVFGGDPEPLIANSGTPGRLSPVDGGYLLNGQWKIVSGAHAAQWFLLAGLVFDGEGPRMVATGEATGEDGPPMPVFVFCCVPREEVKVLDTWDVHGMRGTDSNSVSAADLFVPREMTMPLDAAARIDRPLYRMPIANLVFPGSAAVLIGMAQAAVDELASLAHAKIGLDGTPLAAQPRVQAAVGRATAQVAAARLLLLETAAELDRAAARGEAVTEAQRGLVRGAICNVTEVSRAVLTSMYEMGGSDPLYAGSRLGRIFRDGMAAAQQVNLSPAHFELAGRTRLGLPSNALFV